MKRSLLLVSLLFSGVAFAQDTQSAKQEVEAAQADLDGAMQSTEDLKAKLADCHARLAEISGKPEHAAEIEAKNGESRTMQKDYEAALKACEAKREHLQGVLSRVGKNHHVAQKNGKFTVVKFEERTVAPSQQGTTVETREAYAVGTNYPRARRAVQR